eukprot:3729224-Rhodomonas_salina.4
MARQKRGGEERNWRALSAAALEIELGEGDGKSCARPHATRLASAFPEEGDVSARESVQEMRTKHRGEEGEWCVLKEESSNARRGGRACLSILELRQGDHCRVARLGQHWRACCGRRLHLPQTHHTAKQIGFT